MKLQKQINLAKEALEEYKSNESDEKGKSRKPIFPNSKRRKNKVKEVVIFFAIIDKSDTNDTIVNKSVSFSTSRVLTFHSFLLLLCLKVI